MGRAPCCDKNGLKKGPWTPEEDQKLIDYIQKHGYGNWRTLPKNAGLQRCGKSCRLRWSNYLRPDIKRGRFSFEEEETIIQLHSILGNKWSAIAARLPGRTDNEIKNYWNTHIRKRLLRMGIDPVTHSPRLDLLDLSSILSNQMNLSRLLGVQSFVNPELLKVAASPMPSSQRENQNQNKNQSFLLQHDEGNQFCGFQQVQNQYDPPLMQENPQLFVSNETEHVNPNVDPFPSNQLVGVQLCGWQNNSMGSNLTEDFVPVSPNYNYYGGSDQTAVMDPSSETTNFYFNNNSSKQSFGFASVLSTPSSSPTPLNSCSTNYISGSSSTEDERESYCSSILNFGIPDILDVNEFQSLIN